MHVRLLVPRREGVEERGGGFNDVHYWEMVLLRPDGRERKASAASIAAVRNCEKLSSVAAVCLLVFESVSLAFSLLASCARLSLLGGCSTIKNAAHHRTFLASSMHTYVSMRVSV